jgi:uncharacterized protein YegJ (DUF2314 family)
LVHDGFSLTYFEWGEWIMSLVSTATRVCALTVALVAASACGDARKLPAQRGEPAREFDGKTRLLYTNAGDEAMNAAVERGRATVSQLLTRLEHTPRGLSYIGVKVRLGDPEGAGEHIWLYDVTYTDGTIAGKLMDDAQMLPGFHAGDVVRVEPGQISDWMTVENGRACGGFTNRVMLAEMNAKERAAYLTEMGIPRLPPGNTICDDPSGGSEN